jgi:hypothetical protein
MNSAQGLILAMYAGFGGLLLLAGYVYKEASLRKERISRRELPFGTANRAGGDEGHESQKRISVER